MHACAHGNEEALGELKRIENEGLRITTTPISASELFEGAYGSRRVEKEVEKVREILKKIELLNFTLDVSERYGKLVHDLNSTGRFIGDLDSLIASIAITYNEPLLTTNVDHFQRVPGLIVRTW